MPQSVFVIVFNAVTLSLAGPTCNDDDDDEYCWASSSSWWCHHHFSAANRKMVCRLKTSTLQQITHQITTLDGSIPLTKVAVQSGAPFGRYDRKRSTLKANNNI
jgi:hypothetical protein